MKIASMAARRAYLELTALLIEREIARFRRGEQTALVSFGNVAVLAGNARHELMAVNGGHRLEELIYRSLGDRSEGAVQMSFGDRSSQAAPSASQDDASIPSAAIKMPCACSCRTGRPLQP
jgi:hypothetical protein